MSQRLVEAFDPNFFGLFTAEVTLFIGLVLLILIPNLGKGTFRLPGTQARIPWFLGGQRFEWNANPRLPSLIALLIMVSATVQMGIRVFTESAPVLVHATGDASVKILSANPFSNLMEFFFFVALTLVILASINRLDVKNPKDRSISALYNNRRQADFYILIITCALGMSFVALAENLFVLFIGLELASFSTYILVAFNKESKAGSESGMKYFIVGSAASGVGLYGLSLLYLWSGSLQIDILQEAWAGIGQETLPYVALGLVLVGFGFKISAAPFHFAAPDAYAGAPSTISGLLATASKGMGMIGIIKILLVITQPEALEGSAIWLYTIALLSVITMFWGNLAALGSDNPKRMLAYSSVAHAGYMLAAITAAGLWNISGDVSAQDEAILASRTVLAAILFHLGVLVAFKLGAFLVLSILEMEKDVTSSDSLAGLSKRSPMLAVAMFIFMLSLAGVPPLSGFLSKLLVLLGIIKVAIANSADASFLGMNLHWVWGLALAMGINSAISVYYYLRVGVVMFFHEPTEGMDKELPRGTMIRFSVAICVILTVVLGVYGEFLLDACRSAADYLMPMMRGL